jgi:hypothetical protein
MSTSVRVVMPIGEYTAPRCLVDQDVPGELTVTDEHDNVMRVFYEGEWLSATCYGEGGHPLYWFHSELLERRAREAAAFLHQREVAC